MEKKEIRKRIASLVSSLAPDEKKSASEKICSRIISMDEYKNADIVLSYMATEDEADPIAVSKDALLKEKMLCLPRTKKTGRIMEFHIMSNDLPLEKQLEKGRWGIQEPCEDLPVLEKNMLSGKKIFWIVPGVSFSESGRRLGHGMGFYDIYAERFMDACKREYASVYLLGICFSCQIDECVDAVSDAHDIIMDSLIYQ